MGVWVFSLGHINAWGHWSAPLPELIPECGCNLLGRVCAQVFGWGVGALVSNGVTGNIGGSSLGPAICTLDGDRVGMLVGGVVRMLVFHSGWNGGWLSGLNVIWRMDLNVGWWS